jgi:hypothetical protein
MTEKAAETETLRRLFRVFSAARGKGSSPVYEVLSEAVAGDDDLLDLLLSAPAEQRRPSLLFAAVNLLLAEDPGAGLAAYYPIHGGLRPPDSALAPAFAAFCAEHRGELARLLRDGSTQTNDIRRCVALRLGLDYVRRRWPGALALVEGRAGPAPGSTCCSTGTAIAFTRRTLRERPTRTLRERRQSEPTPISGGSLRPATRPTTSAGCPPDHPRRALLAGRG